MSPFFVTPLSPKLVIRYILFYPHLCTVNQNAMHTTNNIKEQILFRAQLLLHYNELLAAQCDSWLSEEEGLRNMEKSIRERDKAQKKSVWRKKTNE